MKINNDMVLAAQKGDARAIENVAKCFADIAAVKWHQCRALRIVVSLEDFQQDVAIRWWQAYRSFDPSRARATTWSFMIVNTALKRTLTFHGCSMRKPRGVRRPMFESLEPIVKKRREDEPIKVRALPGLKLTEMEVDILTMFARGRTQSHVARATGLTRARIGQIKDGLREKFVDTRRGAKKKTRKKCAVQKGGATNAI